MFNVSLGQPAKAAKLAAVIKKLATKNTEALKPQTTNENTKSKIKSSTSTSNRKQKTLQKTPKTLQKNPNRQIF